MLRHSGILIQKGRTLTCLTITKREASQLAPLFEATCAVIKICAPEDTQTMQISRSNAPSFAVQNESIHA